MSEVKERGFIEGNKITFYVFMPIGMALYEIFTTGWEETDYWGLIVSLTFMLIFMTGMNWLVVKWEIWLDKKLEERRLRKAKLKDINL